MQRKILFTAGGKNIYGYNSNQVLAFQSGLSIDADGGPHAYHPVSRLGWDYLANAGEPGNWWALVTDNGQPNGTPVVQGANDPAPGFYVSTTTLEDTTKSVSDPARYVDSESIPYVALPPHIKQFFKLGDIGYAFHKMHKVYSYFIFADIGPGNHIGEGSIKLAKNLGINGDPKTGGIDSGIVYILFPGSGDGKVKTSEEIQSIGDEISGQIDLSEILGDF